MSYKYILIADYPAPWREKVYEIVYRALGDAFHVVYCTRKEARRLWSFPLGSHPKTFLSTLTLRIGNGERFFSPGIVPFIAANRPKVLIGFSLYPTTLLGMAVGRLCRSKLVVFADTWLGRDRGINRLQRLTRKAVYRTCGDAFIGASRQTLRMFRYYRPGLRDDRLFLSPLCADNEYFLSYLTSAKTEKAFDLLFAGRISPEKNPLFFADVAVRLRERVGACRVLILGDGDRRLREAMFQRLREGEVSLEWPGFVEQPRLPHYYSQARILLLPTTGDCWGVVLN
jgi:glycosyltransferase involved in cell wall biosynthesis